RHLAARRKPRQTSLKPSSRNGRPSLKRRAPKSTESCFRREQSQSAELPRVFAPDSRKTSLCLRSQQRTPSAPIIEPVRETEMCHEHLPAMPFALLRFLDELDCPLDVPFC